MEHVNVAKSYRWHAYFLTSVAASVSIYLLGGVLSAILGATWPAYGAIALAILPNLAAVYTGFMSLFAYRTDAKHLAAADAAYQPKWVRWTLGHILLLGWLASALYLFRRGRHVGNDYTGTYLEAVPLFGSTNIAPDGATVPTKSETESDEHESCPNCDLSLAMGVTECQRCGWTPHAESEADQKSGSDPSSPA